MSIAFVLNKLNTLPEASVNVTVILQADPASFDINKDRINELKDGIDVTGELSTQELKNATNISYTANLDKLKNCSIFIVTVPTPIDKNKKPLTVVKPGTQSRRFTHIKDTIEVCYYAWKKNNCKHYSISNRKSYTILQVAKMFNSKIRLLPYRRGERYASALTNMNLSNKVYKKFGKVNLTDYIRNIIRKS